MAGFRGCTAKFGVARSRFVLLTRRSVTLKSYPISKDISLEIAKIADTACSHELGTLVLSTDPDNSMASHCPNTKDLNSTANYQNSKFRELYAAYKKTAAIGVKGKEPTRARFGLSAKSPPTSAAHDLNETIEVFMEKEGLGVTRISQATSDVCPWLTDVAV